MNSTSSQYAFASSTARICHRCLSCWIMPLRYQVVRAFGLKRKTEVSRIPDISFAAVCMRAFQIPPRTWLRKVDKHWCRIHGCANCDGSTSRHHGATKSMHDIAQGRKRHAHVGSSTECMLPASDNSAARLNPYGLPSAFRIRYLLTQYRSTSREQIVQECQSLGSNQLL